MTVLIRICGFLYLVSGIWCGWQSNLVAEYLGYSFLNSSGQSEFFTVYAGLQLGLGIAILAGSFQARYIEATSFFTAVFSCVLAITRLISFMLYEVNDSLYLLFLLELGIALVTSFTWYRYTKLS